MTEIIQVGDKVRISVELLKEIYEMPKHHSYVVKVERIQIDESDGTKIIWLGATPV